MKNTVVFLILFFTTSFNCLSQSHNILAIDKKNGFRDIKLESDFTTVNNKYQLIYATSTSLISTYYLKGLDMYIDDMPIEYVSIDFISNKVYSISLKINCGGVVTKLTNLIEKNYGKLKLNKENYDNYIKGGKAELIYQIRGDQKDNGYMSAFAYLTIRSVNLKKKITGKNNGF